ncbi:hypothetical protein [Paenibacillus oleatilyticus]|uniref:hypothetical protein n=1 Tax=Paenibacillus oleatilyticus TaxID=2594886 RepID=UPI001C1F200D|nr:hypothetical protein [Paenibacillus oleatilyticus]MBU7315370.1 hypothetical protein [Paenibacillus oleatilyticus]
MKLSASGGEVTDLPVLHMDDEELQKEMMALLRRMEEAVQQGERLTGEHMIRLSQQLDAYVLIAQTRKMRCIS